MFSHFTFTKLPPPCPFRGLVSCEAATACKVPPAGRPGVLQAPPPDCPQCCCYTLEIYKDFYTVVIIIDLCLSTKECVNSELKAHLLPHWLNFAIAEELVLVDGEMDLVFFSQNSSSEA